MKYFLSLGSNVGNRQTHIEQAIKSLEAGGVRVIQTSSLYETEPVDFAPSVAQSWFYNQVVEVEANLEPVAFLRFAKSIEKRMGRKTSAFLRERIIDIDILLADDNVIHTEELVIPHPGVARRKFVLIPLREISPETNHPVLMKTIKELAETCPDRSAVRKVEA